MGKKSLWRLAIFTRAKALPSADLVSVMVPILIRLEITLKNSSKIRPLKKSWRILENPLFALNF